MKEKFIGGRGYGTEFVVGCHHTGQTKWNDPENEDHHRHRARLPASHSIQDTGKSICVPFSPQTDIPIDSNVGGFFGPFSEILRLRRH
jgi:aldehyde:ferredoxin oxidoreductase